MQRRRSSSAGDLRPFLDAAPSQDAVPQYGQGPHLEAALLVNKPSSGEFQILPLCPRISPSITWRATRSTASHHTPTRQHARGATQSGPHQGPNINRLDVCDAAP
jgi:hypothetical protein